MNSLSNESNTEREASVEPVSLPWVKATVVDIAGADIEKVVSGSNSADSQELSELLRAAAGDTNDTPESRAFNMIAAAAGMLIKPNDRNEPFGAMIVWADGRRSAVLSDFRGAAVDVLAAAAEKATHPALRARLADVVWVLERKRAKFGSVAISAYVEVVKKVDSGDLAFRFDKGAGALKHEVRGLLRRALLIGKATGWEKPEAAAAREKVLELRHRAIAQSLPVPSIWFTDMDLDFGISDPGEVGADVEKCVGSLPRTTDPHVIIDLLRVAVRAYRLAKKVDDQQRCQSAAAEQFVKMADAQPMAMMASSMLASAISELHGVSGKKERRKELRHRLVDVQANILEEMSSFSYPLDLEAIAREVRESVGRHATLRDKLFVFAALDRSPDPAALEAEAIQTIRKHPLSSLFGASHHDREGKVVHRTKGGGLGDGEDRDAIEHQISRDEDIRRQVVSSGQIDVARQAIARDRFLSDDVFIALLVHSAFVPSDLVATFSRGFLRFFQGDLVSALYILTPLLENSLRHVLKAHGHDVTIFDDGSETQQDRTISSLFEQMRSEMDAIFGVAITSDIARVFLSKPGPYLRHALSHGLLHDGDPYGHDAIYACWLIFHLCLLPLFPHREAIHLPFDEQA